MLIYILAFSFLMATAIATTSLISIFHHIRILETFALPNLDLATTDAAYRKQLFVLISVEGGLGSLAV